jgi:DNA-binding MarR family transcriptional regulator
VVKPLEAHLGYWLRFVSNHVSHAFSLKLDACDVTVAEWVILRELFEHETVAPSDLASRLGMTRGAISKLVDRLALKSFVAKTSSSDDRRYQALELTPNGRRLVPILSALADANEAEFFGHLEATELTMIENVMKKIVQRHGFRKVPVE